MTCCDGLPKYNFKQSRRHKLYAATQPDWHRQGPGVANIEQSEFCLRERKGRRIVIICEKKKVSVGRTTRGLRDIINVRTA